MPDLLTTYSNHCGVKNTHKPYFPECYFPCPEKYITVHPSSGMKSKNYDYYSDVVSMIKEKISLPVIQIGGEGDKPIEGCMIYSGLTTMRQAAYIVKNSLLHIGNDSIWAHFAGANDVPFVTLYGPTIPESCGPAFGSGITLQSHRNGRKPSFSPEEADKSINLIRPEQVAEAALKTLEPDKNISIPYKTLFMGSDYHKSFLEVIPDHVIPPSMLQGETLNVRYDLGGKEFLLERIVHFYPCFVSTKKRFNPNYLKFFRHNIKLVIYYFDEPDIDWIKCLESSGIGYQLIYTGPEEKLGDVRRELIDFGTPVIQKEKFNPERIKDLGISKTSKFKTNKFILSENQVFLSLYHWENGMNVADNRNSSDYLGKCLDHEGFLSQLEHYYIYDEP